MAQLSDKELKEKIISELRNSKRSMKALDISRSVKAPKKDVNRVLHNCMRREAEIKNPGQNPPLWGLVDLSPSSSSRVSSSGAAGGCNPPSGSSLASQGSSGIGSNIGPTSSVPLRASSSPGTSGGCNPPPSQSLKESEGLYSKSEGGDGSITFTPVSGLANGTQILPRLQSAASGQASPQQEGVEATLTSISETRTNYDPDVKLQPNNHTSVGAVNSPISAGKEKKKKKPKRAIAASSPVAEENSHQSSGDTHQKSAGSTSHIAQETESADDAHMGQEGERPDNEHITQEEQVEDLSLSLEQTAENLSYQTFQSPVAQGEERLNNITQEQLAEDLSSLTFQPPVEQGQ